ncbi:MAG: hypothetical protein JWR52_2351 [Marmoricola sp.]|nr:hypothetical protein [Marmoricola sp.]
MNKTSIALGAVLAGAGFVVASTASGQADAHQRFTVVAKAPRNSLLAHPCAQCIDFSQPDGAHIGGTEYDSGAITSHGKVVGHFALVSIGVSPFTQARPGELQLTASMKLPGGQLVGQGLEEPPLDGGVLAITGGTGRYAHARGTVRYTDHANGDTTLHIDLVD